MYLKKGFKMKKQLLVLTALLALFASNSVAMLNLQPLDPSKPLEIKKLTDTVKASSTQTQIPGQTGRYTSPIDIGNLDRALKDINEASSVKLKNMALASTALKETYLDIIDQVDTKINTSNLDAREVDLLTTALVRLYNGDTYSQIINAPISNKPLPGFKEGPVGRLFTYIASTANVIQTIHNNFETVLPVAGIPAQHGGILQNKEKFQHFIAYVIGILAIYKSSPKALEKTTSPALPIYPVNS